jgi:hypothetical protein
MSVLGNDVATMQPTCKERQVLREGITHSVTDIEIDRVASIRYTAYTTLDDKDRTGTHESENIPINPFSLSHIPSP